MQVMEAGDVIGNDKVVGVYDCMGEECRESYVCFCA